MNKIKMYGVLLVVGSLGASGAFVAAAEDSRQGFMTVAAATETVPSQETRQETQKKAEARLNELGDHIRELKERAEKAKDKARADLNDIIKELDKKVAGAKQQLVKLKAASAQAWEDAKSRTNTALDDLEKTYQRAMKQIKESA